MRTLLVAVSLATIVPIGGCSSAELEVAGVEDAGSETLGGDALLDDVVPADDSAPRHDSAPTPDTSPPLDSSDAGSDGRIDASDDVVVVDGAEDGTDAPTCDAPVRCHLDRDGDGYVVTAGAFDACVCPSGSRTIAPTGTLFDCDDDDPSVHPGAGFQPTAYCVPGTSCTVKSFDYDCNGSEDKELGGTFGGCSSFGSGCVGAGWQSSTPDCGAPHDFVTCAKGALSCSSSVSSRTQRCR